MVIIAAAKFAAISRQLGPDRNSNGKLRSRNSVVMQIMSHPMASTAESSPSIVKAVGGSVSLVLCSRVVMVSAVPGVMRGAM